MVTHTVLVDFKQNWSAVYRGKVRVWEGHDSNLDVVTLGHVVGPVATYLRVIEMELGDRRRWPERLDLALTDPEEA